MPRQNLSRLNSIIDRFKDARVAVIGDIMLDRYIKGSVKRISPEAPVPVVRVKEEKRVCGGSGNVACNLAALGARPALAALVGEDAAAGELRVILSAQGVASSFLVSDPSFRTIEKTRVIAEHQQVVRYDKDPEGHIPRSAALRLEQALRDELAAGAKAVILSDYGKGILVPATIKRFTAICRKAGVPVFVDPKVEHFRQYKGVTCLTPNTLEAFSGMGLPVKDGPEAVEKLGRDIIRALGSRALLITQGENGMTLFEKRGSSVSSSHIPTRAREVYDVTGAGDTVISVLALAVAAGADLHEAALIANFAAGVVVGKLGTAVVTPAELKETMKEWLKTA
ncbi:MAG: D-glycero-beta-D-manno-heptose-7-phosphate kinase [Elusimicrobiales bacterium]|nr:D-glycero-beta-D-manno-heptose-7-phosphate kinase [Elusimicrobiales bacterium]